MEILERSRGGGRRTGELRSPSIDPVECPLPGGPDLLGDIRGGSTDASVESGGNLLAEGGDRGGRCGGLGRADRGAGAGGSGRTERPLRFVRGREVASSRGQSPKGGGEDAVSCLTRTGGGGGGDSGPSVDIAFCTEEL